MFDVFGRDYDVIGFAADVAGTVLAAVAKRHELSYPVVGKIGRHANFVTGHAVRPSMVWGVPMAKDYDRGHFFVAIHVQLRVAGVHRSFLLNVIGIIKTTIFFVGFAV